MGDPIRRTEFTGSQYGLKLVLNVNQSEYVGILSPTAGIRVALHNPYEVPFPENNVSNFLAFFCIKWKLSFEQN